MSASRLELGETLDAASELVSEVAAPFVGVLWLTALPLRLLQAWLLARLSILGPEARGYGEHLQGLAFFVVAAFLVSLWGRAVFVRACGLRLRTNAAPGRAALRVQGAALVSYVYAALLFEAGFLATLAVVVVAPVFVLFAGLAAATLPESDGAGLIAPIRRVLRQATEGWHLVGLLLVFGAALVLAALNLYLVFELGLWLGGGVAGFDVLRWDALLQLGNPRFFWLICAGATLLVEPYWLTAHVVYVLKRESRTSGEDLRLWFERLASKAAA